MSVSGWGALDVLTYNGLDYVSYDQHKQRCDELVRLREATIAQLRAQLDKAQGVDKQDLATADVRWASPKDGIEDMTIADAAFLVTIHALSLRAEKFDAQEIVNGAAEVARLSVGGSRQ